MIRKLLVKVLAGVDGLVRVVLRRDAAGEVVVAYRLLACRDCVANRRCLVRYCGECGCWLWAKTRLYSESCDRGRWIE